MATLADLREEVQEELDLQDEDFISNAEILQYIKRAINSAENLIHTLYEDYFLDEPHTLTTVSGQQAYDLPTGIYAQKIRKVIYNPNGDDTYLVRKIKKLEHTSVIEAEDDYMFLLTNSGTNGVKLRLYPTPQASGEQIQVWYLRNANEPSADTDVIDLPEAYTYIKQYVKDECIKKERMTPDAPKSPALAEEERLLIEALTERIPDDDNSIEPDTSFYREVN